MVLEIKAYQCPICETLFRTTVESEECYSSCLMFRDPDTQAFVCSKCGDLYRTEASAKRHEEECRQTPDFQDKPCSVTCLTCKHSDPEGHRWAPCPEHHSAPVKAACEVYEYAER